MSRTDSVFRILLTNSFGIGRIFFSLFAFCILAVSLTFFALSVGKPYMGVILSIDTKGLIVESVDINGSASEAGIQVGDNVIEVNGQPAQAFQEKYEKAGAVYGRLIKELTVIDDDGHLKLVILENASPHWRTLVELITWFIACIISWVTGFYVFFKRPRNLTALLLCLCGLAFGLALSGNMAGERAIHTAFWFETAAAIIGPWLLLHFFLILPEERSWLRTNPCIYLIYLPAAITLILFPLIGYADGQPLLGFRTFRLFEYGFGFLAAAVVAILNYFRAVSIRTRQQMKIVLICCLIALVPQLFFNLLPAAMRTQPVISSGFSILFLVFIPIGMGYTVITQKLMDIDFVIRRGMVYGLITLVMAAIISVAVFFVAVYQTSIETPIQVLVALALGSIAAVLFGPIKKKIEILVDRLFYKDRYDYRQVIQSLSSALNSVNSLSDISRLIVGTTVNTLNLKGSCLFVKTQSDSLEIVASQGTFINADKQENLRGLISQQNRSVEFPNSATTLDSDISFIIRLIAGKQEISVLCLSQKASGQRFSSDDSYLIQGISSVSSIALHSAMLVRDVNIRDTFVSIASHELRTPLTAIMGYAELLLRREQTDATKKKWLKNILNSGRKITAMANDLLNVSRIQSGKLVLNLKLLKLSGILEEQVEIAREGANKHDIVVDIDPNIPDVMADRDKFGQIIANLLDNAVKYSPKGGRITLTAHDDSSQNCVIVSVTDEGIGISPEDQSMLFTTFHRIQRAETQSIKGSGLGLFIAKEWTEAMGGKIWVESELNKGSTFFVAIPTQLTQQDQ